MTPVTTDEQLRSAWTAAVNLHGRAHPIIGRVFAMSEEWQRMHGEDRDHHRLIALRLLQEIGPD